ncbi:MAG TPA: PQQ-dependent sugar dehydrogenase, partial [Labilithrix sp.]|nr:PQQ-dependent sugar dehydrogenase [Labilithrix sp.]
SVVTTVLPSLATLATSSLGANTPIQTNGEGGFLGFAFHPKFAQNGKIYVTWTSATGSGPVNMQSRVGVIHSPDGGASFDSYADVITPFDQPFTNHDGGGIAFGKDGFLYFSYGDGGAADDTARHGQNKDTFFSKINRIDVDNPAGGKPYGIPNDNPFKNGGGEPATFAYGFRNPFRFSIDRESNEVWVGDVGQNKWEEIDAKVKNGGNYGWPCREGLHDSPNASDTAKCPPGTVGTIDPVAELEHVPANTRSITGGVVYRGKAIPDFVGSYVYGDYQKQQMWTISFDPGTGAAKNEQLMDAPAANWVDFAEDNDGEVYAVALNQGSVYKLNAAAPPGPNNFPDRLSKTGCVDPSDPKQPASGLVAYGVNAPLWSDGAVKDRWLALPDGTSITVQEADGDFDFPNGTVLVKNFSVGGKRIETRLFTRHEDGGWAGYTFEWLDDQSDAVFLKSSKSKAVGSQTWAFPSRSDCVACHSEAAGRALGPELGQLNGEFVYPSTNRLSNQLKTLDHIGMFDKPLGKPVDQLIAYPDPQGSAGTLEQRARAYLHSNCANCHQPKGGGRGNLDLRFGTSLKDTKSCNVDNEAGDLGVAGGKLLVPGSPQTSLLSVRPHSPAANRMPPLASSVVDDKGVKVLDDWIRSITACP